MGAVFDPNAGCIADSELSTRENSTRYHGSMSDEIVVYIGASSPLLKYSPYRNGPTGSSWLQTGNGGSECSGPTTFAVELDGLYCRVIFRTGKENGADEHSLGPRVCMDRIQQLSSPGRSGWGATKRFGIVRNRQSVLVIREPYGGAAGDFLLVLLRPGQLSTDRSEDQDGSDVLRVRSSSTYAQDC